MIPCDKCGKLVDERSLQIRELGQGRSLFLCLACNGYYADEELLESDLNFHLDQ